MIQTRTFFSVLLFCLALSARAEVAVPPLTGHVIDQTGTLSSDQLVELEQKLQDLDAKKGTQVAVLITPTSQPETIEQFSLRVAEQWKLGRKQVDDGAILVIAKDDRSLRIEVGYGLEGALNDATSKRIIAETITPYFQRGDFSAGINAGVDQILQVIDGESLPPSNPKISNAVASIQQYFPIIFILALVLGALLSAVLGRLLGSVLTGGAIALVAWLFIGVLYIALIAGAIALLFTLISGAAPGRAGLGGFGRGGFGGGGGGFSGGGGSFGGGGASGRW